MKQINYQFLVRFLLLPCICLGMTLSAMAQNGAGIDIRGTVSDDSGPIQGATVMVKETSVGVLTDANGEFAIKVPGNESTLVVSYLGYVPQEIRVGDRRIIPVHMLEDQTQIEQVTVVAFGQQKKESVIGSITTVNPGELRAPSSNLTTSFAGNMAGVIAYQRSGEPGQDNADFFVRGVTTFGTNTNPLILIDGIELTSTDLARLQPDDIESFSVMKDATATALYGARGANGVILVTTKQGKVGPAKIALRFENSFSMPTRNVELADPITYMQLNNEAVVTRNPLNPAPYSQQKIERTLAGTDPTYYPAVDWMNTLLKTMTTNQRANLNVSGGGGVARYYVAGSLNHDTGMFKVDKRNNFNNNINNMSYSLRANVNIDITKTTEMAVRMSGNFDDYSGPIPGGAEMYRMVMHTNPVLFQPYYEPDYDHRYVNHIMFGNYDQGQYTNPYAEMVRGYKDWTRSQLQAQMELKQDLSFLTEGLSIRGMININRTAQFSVSRFYNPFYYKTSGYDPATGKYGYTLLNENSGTEYLDYSENPSDKVTSSNTYFEGTVNYLRTFKEKHTVSALLVFMARNSLLANTGDLQLSLPSRNVGISGRATYDYGSRYFLEFNFGYNGSERFHKSHRYGFFPSAGVAWIVSNEKFWENIKPVVSNLKLRYSIGLVGNDQIGSALDRFFYLSQVNLNDAGKTGMFGQELNYGRPGVSISRYANNDITWETSLKSNYALELGLWNKVTVIAEYFTEHRKNILMDRAHITSIMGLAAPVKANLGEATGRGVDVSLEYQQVINPDLWLSARGNFTFARSEYKVVEEPQYDESWRYLKGRSIHQQYGFIAERLFVDDAEAANSPRQEVGQSVYGGGDVKYLDVNNDGVVDEKDMVPIGNPLIPEIVYGFGFSIGYKNFDFSAFFQGSANQSFWINAAETYPFQGQTQMLKAYADNHWSESNRDIYALWPRLSADANTNNVPGFRSGNGTYEWNNSSTWFMRDGTFLRLKQVEIGYTLPKKWKWQQKVRINNLRFYVSGTNLLLFSKFKLWDIEMAGNGLGYPLQRVFNVGLNITFN